MLCDCKHREVFVTGDENARLHSMIILASMLGFGQQALGIEGMQMRLDETTDATLIEINNFVIDNLEDIKSLGMFMSYLLFHLSFVYIMLIRMFTVHILTLWSVPDSIPQRTADKIIKATKTDVIRLFSCMKKITVSMERNTNKRQNQDEMNKERNRVTERNTNKSQNQDEMKGSNKEENDTVMQRRNDGEGANKELKQPKTKGKRRGPPKGRWTEEVIQKSKTNRDNNSKIIGNLDSLSVYFYVYVYVYVWYI